jgi:hypothetical protein
MQVPALHVLALLPQSASMQQLVAEMHAPLQTFSPATGHDVTGASRPASSRDPAPDSRFPVDPLWVEESAA